MVHKQPSPSGSGGLWTINPCLLWFIYNVPSKTLDETLQDKTHSTHESFSSDIIQYCMAVLLEV